MDTGQLIRMLAGGVRLGGYTVRADRVARGRFAEEENARLLVEKGGKRARLMYVKVFHGRGRYYRRWVELYAIEPEPLPGLRYHGSRLERELLSLVSSALGGGDKIHVEYLGDWETEAQLQRGYPEAASRLGYLLFKLGFTWFKDWYFPEGFLEGEYKLQGEKPASEEDRARQLGRMAAELKRFLREPCGDWVCMRARGRAQAVLAEIPVRYGGWG